MRGGGEEGGGDEQQQKTDVVMLEKTSQQMVAMTKTPSCFTVLRNRKSLRLLSGWCRPTSSKGQRPHRDVEVPPLSQQAVASFLMSHRMNLVWVRLSLLSKGKPEIHAMVCVPTEEDLKLLGKNPGSGPVEPPHRDPFKSRLQSHKKGSRKAARNPTSTDDPEGQRSDPLSIHDSVTATAAQSSSHVSSDLILGLWPDPLPEITSHCSRVTLGWVTQGDFSLSAGCGEALGFISVAGLLNTLLKQPVAHRGKLLLRNPDSLHYRYAKINIEV